MIKSFACTNAILNKSNLAPGEETELKVSARLPHAYSDMTLVRSLETDHPRFPKWDYTLRQCTVPPLMVSPSHITFGPFRRSDLDAGGRLRSEPIPGSAVLDVFSDRTVEQPTPPIIGTAEGLRVDVVPDGQPEEIGKGLLHRRYRLSVRLDPNLPYGPGKEERLISVSDARGTEAPLTVAWRLDPPLRAVPSPISLGVIAHEAHSRAGRVLIKSNEGREFRILSAIPDPIDGASIQIIGLESTAIPAKSHSLEILLRPSGSSKSSHSGMIRILTDDPELPTLDVAWSAFVRDEAGLPHADPSARPRTQWSSP